MNEATNLETRRRGTRTDGNTSILMNSSSENISHVDIPRDSSWDDVSLEDNNYDGKKETKPTSPKESAFQIGLHLQLYFRNGLQFDKSKTRNVSMRAKLKSRRSMLFFLTFMLLGSLMVYWRMNQFQAIEENSNLASNLDPVPLVIDHVPKHIQQASLARTNPAAPPAEKRSPPYVPIQPDSTGLPNVEYGCSSTDRDVEEIQLHVIVWRRGTSTERLLNQLKNASYVGWDKPVNLYIHMDGGGSGWVKNICTKFEWKYGEKILDIRTDNIGLRGIWLTSLEEASREAGDNTLMVVLEDDIRVSQHYFQGLLAMIDAYGRNRECRDKNLMGFSLSPIKLEELRKPFKRWYAAKALGERSNKANRHIAYLSVVPSSWGVAYWSDRWQEFADFADHRIKPPFFDHQAEAIGHNAKGNYDKLQLTPEALQIPDSRSNLWPRSWKRFLVDFMYARGLVMLYPSLPGEQGFATTLALSGEHVSSPTTSKARKANPRITSLIEDFGLPKTGEFPLYGNLAVFGLHLEPTTREELATQGAKFLHSVRQNCHGDCQDLLNHWARPETFTSTNNDLVDSSPQICAADLYMPASANSPAVAKTIHLPPKQKYLLFEPSYGGNNQFYAIIEALYWASVLDRKLIVPPIFLPRVSSFDFTLPFEEWPDTESVLEFGNLDENTLSEHARRNLPLPNKNKPIGFKEWMNSRGNTTATVSRILRISRDAIFDQPSRKLTELLEPEGKIVTVNLRHLFDKQFRSAKEIQQYLGGCQDEVLAFEGMFFADILNVNKYVLATDVASLSERANEIYKMVQNKLFGQLGTKDYTCFHVRLGDFSEMCSSKQISKIPFYNILKSQGFACETTLEQVKEAVVSNKRPAFIMSDNSEMLESVLPSSNKFVTSGWIQELILLSNNEKFNSAELDLLSMSIEQEICKDANDAILNKYSTVSRRIENLRRDQGIVYWKRPVQEKQPMPEVKFVDLLVQEGDAWQRVDSSIQ